MIIFLRACCKICHVGGLPLDYSRNYRRSGCIQLPSVSWILR